jgi:hypothetical protein
MDEAGARSFNFAAFVDDEDDDDLISAAIAVHGEGMVDDFHDPFLQRDESKREASHDWELEENHPAPFDDSENRDNYKEPNGDYDDDDHRPSTSLLHVSGGAQRNKMHGDDDEGMMMMQTKKLSDDGLDAIGEEIRERSAREEKRLKYRQTMVYCGTYVAQGLAGGCIGPTLLLLAANTSSTVDDMGLIFTLRGVRHTTRHDKRRTRTHGTTHAAHALTTRHTQLGWIVGSLCAGRLYESTGKRSHAVLFGSTMAMAAFLLVFPFARSLWLLLALQAVNAFFASFNDVGANTLMFQVWQRQVAPYMQFLHFSYGVGTAPLLSTPPLSSLFSLLLSSSN